MVGVCIGWFIGVADCIDNSKFSIDEGSHCKSGKKFKNGIEQAVSS